MRTVRTYFLSASCTPCNCFCLGGVAVICGKLSKTRNRSNHNINFHVTQRPTQYTTARDSTAPRWHGSGLVKVSLYCILAGFYLMTRFSLEFFRAHVVHGEVQLIKSWTYRSDSSLVLVINHQLLFHKTMLITEITVITVIFRSSDRLAASQHSYGQILSLKTLSRNHFLQTII